MSKAKIIIMTPFWILEFIVEEIYWYFKRKQKGYKRNTSNSLADDYIEDNYGI